MDLVDHSNPPQNIRSGRDEVGVVAGDYLQIRTGTLGDPIIELQEQCPVGKVWSVHVSVDIIETSV